jgi:hypothetical protein
VIGPPFHRRPKPVALGIDIDKRFRDYQDVTRFVKV